MSGNTRHSPVRMSKQIYAEAESRTNLFVLPRREQFADSRFLITFGGLNRLKPRPHWRMPISLAGASMKI